MDKLTRRLMLFDFYGALLTDKQKEVYDLYYQQDLSLGEIAEIWQVSRASVYDLLRRTEQGLEKYEAALALLDDFNQREQILKSLSECLEAGDKEIPESWRDRLHALISELVSI